MLPADPLDYTCRLSFDRNDCTSVQLLIYEKTGVEKIDTKRVKRIRRSSGDGGLAAVKLLAATPKLEPV